MMTTVVFDLDDTLYDEIDYCYSGFAAVAEFLANSLKVASAERIFDAFWAQFTAGNHTRTFNGALEELGTVYDEKLIRESIDVYRNHLPKIKLPADSRNVLAQLSAEYTLALLTDGFLPAQKLKVDALGIEKYFRCILYTEQLGREFWKPSPVGFERLIAALDAKPETTAYVADNAIKDFIAPNQLGLSTIQIMRPARIHTQSSQRPDAVPGHVIGKISELPALLKRL